VDPTTPIKIWKSKLINADEDNERLQIKLDAPDVKTVVTYMVMEGCFHQQVCPLG
jgi:hypothetical protein